MTIKVGDRLPAGTVQEFIEVEGGGCSIGPNTFKVEDLVKGKKIAVFGLPGAFTPTCSAKHVPSYLANYEKLKAKGVDEIWCFAVNDAFVMGAWARDQKAGGKIRFMGDGSAAYAKALGLELDLNRPRHGHALPALLDAGGRRRREDAQRRGPRQVRGLRRRHDARAGRLRKGGRFLRTVPFRFSPCRPPAARGTARRGCPGRGRRSSTRTSGSRRIPRPSAR